MYVVVHMPQYTYMDHVYLYTPFGRTKDCMQGLFFDEFLLNRETELVRGFSPKLTVNVRE